ncbi:MAG TPA: TonB-dependent receptor plug domain-containing protein [Allosphingosinicella sp.]|jgi:hypothetical protein
MVSRLALAAALLAGATAARAQDEKATGDAPPPEASPAPTVEGPRTYTPADFTRFAPKTALDMLNQVPGFVIRQASQERGLGQATGNVLINGQRISGKSNDAVSELGRIPSQNVLRIEILDGATLDIPGLSGQVANIVATAAKKTSGQFTWQPEFRQRFTDPILMRGQASVTGKKGPVEYTLGLQNSANHGGAGGRTYIYSPTRDLIDTRWDVFTNESNNPRVSARFGIDGPGSSVGNLNLSYQRGYYDYLEVSERTGAGQPDRVRDVSSTQNGYNYEMGGDYDLPLGSGRLKLIGLNRFSHQPFTETAITRFANGQGDLGSRFARVAEEKERIGRLEYRWKGGGADWQLSGEAAFNSLDSVSRLFTLKSNGEFSEVPFPGGTAEVKEDRYEVMASHGRSLAKNLSLQLSAGGEYSNLRQIGSNGLSRTFWRPKGLVSFAWKPEPNLDVDLKLQRKVGQLNFSQFLATVNLVDDKKNAGNAELVPQQSWEADLEGTRSFGRYGTTTLRLYGRLIDDIVDIIPIGETGESPGNLDRATIFGFEWKTTFQFEPMGWRGAKLDARVQTQRSRVEDPLTGEKRPISGSLHRSIDVSLRHDIPDSNWAWGAGISHFIPTRSVRLTEVGRQWEGPVIPNFFVEHKDVLGLTVRASLINFPATYRSYLDRTVYVGRRTGPVAFIEDRDRVVGPIVSFQVRGKF